MVNKDIFILTLDTRSMWNYQNNSKVTLIKGHDHTSLGKFKLDQLIQSQEILGNTAAIDN